MCSSLTVAKGASAFSQKFQLEAVAKRTAEMQSANRKLSILSSTDPLTGLANKRVFDQILGWECARVQRMNSVASLLPIDADHFKDLNDSKGHLRGDDCVVALSAELTRLCRRKLDLTARYGGEELAMILPLTKTADRERTAESLRQAIAGLKIAHPTSPVASYFTVSIGVATATREWCCTPRLCFSWFNVRTTSSPFELCPTVTATPSRVKTSTVVSARKRRPSCNWSATKPILHA